MRTASSENQRTEELGGVKDLAPRLRDRLAHLQGHQQGEFVGSSHDLLEGTPQDLPALARRVLLPPGLGFTRRPKRREGILGARVGHRAKSLAGRGILHDHRVASHGLPPFAVDEERLLYAVYYATFRGSRVHVVTISFPGSPGIAVSTE